MRIVCLVDVDDVLNFCGSSRERKRRWYHEGWIRREAFLPQGKFSLLLNPEHGRWLRSLADEGVELAWGSTWEGHANQWVGRALGLPELPAAPVHDPLNKWKTVIPWAAEHYDAIAWLDDQKPELYGAHCLLGYKYPDIPFKTVKVSEELCLTTSDVDEVAEWARGLSHG